MSDIPTPPTFNSPTPHPEPVQSTPTPGFPAYNTPVTPAAPGPQLDSEEVSPVLKTGHTWWVGPLVLFLPYILVFAFSLSDSFTRNWLWDNGFVLGGAVLLVLVWATVLTNGIWEIAKYYSNITRTFLPLVILTPLIWVVSLVLGSLSAINSMIQTFTQITPMMGVG